MNEPDGAHGGASSYSVSAKHYDRAYARKTDLVDEVFYRDLVLAQDGPVLELGCGTGRILLPCARLGATVHGLDVSAAMLSVLREKLVHESGQTRDRVTLHHGDMRTFSLAQRFGLITAPFRVMQHMYSLDDQVAALRSARAHLAPKGKLVFDVFYPKLELILSGVGEETHELEWRSDDGVVIRRAFVKDRVDKIAQVFAGRFIFRSYRNDELIGVEEEHLQMSYYTHPQCHALFRLAELRVVSEWGSFEKAPLDNESDAMVFLLEPA